MYDDKIKKLIERFREVKSNRGLTDEQLSEISGLSPSWIEGLFDGDVRHPRFYETMKLASALGVSPAEIDKILGFNQCECYIGVYWDYDLSKLMTRKNFEDLVNEKHYTREQYCDREFYTNLEKFDFCPKCGKKIEWDKIRENQ